MANPSDRDTAFLPMEGQPKALPEVGEPEGPGNKKKKKKTKTGAGEDPDPATNPIPKYNKRVTSKITGLTSKSTDIRCLETLIMSSTAL